MAGLNEVIKPIQLAPLSEFPLISVLIPNYNYGHLVREAVNSVLKQTYQNFEIIICDDGSTDNSRAVIEKMVQEESRIHAIFQTNRGVSSALNAAFLASKGDLIALLDADDVWLPKRLEKVVRAFRYSSLNPGIVVHPLQVTDLRSGKVVKNQTPRRPDRGWLAPRLLEGERCVFPPASGLTIRREIALRVFPLPEELRTLADGVLVDRAALFSSVEVVDEVLGLYRQHAQNVTGASGQVEKVIAITKVILDTRASFIKSALGLEVDSRLWLQFPSGGWVGEAKLAEKVLKGENISLQEAVQWACGRRKIIWGILSMLPCWWRQRLLRWWWEDIGGLKKIVRFLFPLSP